jgi:hypothetical protein
MNEGEYQHDLDRIFEMRRCEDDYTTTNTNTTNTNTTNTNTTNTNTTNTTNRDLNIPHADIQKPWPPNSPPDIRIFPYAELRAPGPYPNGVDVSNREQHLDNAQFEQMFRMRRSAWPTVPPWKQQSIKKALGLF